MSHNAHADEPLKKKHKTDAPSPPQESTKSHEPAANRPPQPGTQKTVPFTRVAPLAPLASLEPQQSPFVAIDEMFSYHVPSGLVVRPFKRQIMMPNSRPFKATYPETLHAIKARKLNMANYKALAAKCHTQNFIMVEDHGLSRAVALREVYLCGACGRFADDRHDKFAEHMNSENIPEKHTKAGGDFLRKFGYRVVTSTDMALFVLVDGVKKQDLVKANEPAPQSQWGSSPHPTGEPAASQVWPFKHVTPQMLNELTDFMKNWNAMKDPGAGPQHNAFNSGMRADTAPQYHSGSFGIGHQNAQTSMNGASPGSGANSRTNLQNLYPEESVSKSDILSGTDNLQSNEDFLESMSGAADSSP